VTSVVTISDDVGGSSIDTEQHVDDEPEDGSNEEPMENGDHASDPHVACLFNGFSPFLTVFHFIPQVPMVR
jgi:hypothetical protein